MLAGVDYILMGAGIPRAIPGALDLLAQGQPASLPIDVEGALPGEQQTSTFDPQHFCGGAAPRLKRPLFLGIVASATLAIALAKKASGRVDGFVVEGPTAGGHNAPPRGPLQLTPAGEPLYGPRDVPELDKIRALGLPFWLAGGYGRPGKLAEALRLGAAGIQVGTPFAFCDESGIQPEIKRQAIALSRLGQARVFTDPVASPTGFPFKVAQLENTLSNAANYHARRRICDLGYLRHLYRKADGTIGYRCPAEPLEQLSPQRRHRRKKPSAASASATASPPPSAFPRSVPKDLTNSPSSPPATTSPISPNSSRPAPTPTPPPTLSATSCPRRKSPRHWPVSPVRYLPERIAYPRNGPPARPNPGPLRYHPANRLS